MITAILMFALFALLIVGLPVALAAGASGMIGLYFMGGERMVWGILSTTPLSSASKYEFLSIPMFILMAEIIIISRVADELFDTMAIWIGRVRGGLAVATAFAGGGFGAISGSSTAGAATLASTSMPAMLKRGYEPKLAGGVVAISGTLAMLIPPSMAAILYGLVAGQSIGKLLIAGIIPGILVMFSIAGTVMFLVWRNPEIAPTELSYSWAEKLSSLRVTGSMIALMLLVTGSIYTGIATPTEAACLGAFGAMVIAMLRRRLDAKTFVQCLARAARTSAMIGFIIIGAHIFSYALTLTQTTQNLVGWVVSLDMNPYVVLSLIIVMYLTLGLFLDQIAILILTVPILLPVIVSLGFDPIWFGIVIILAAEVGLVTPPMGMNCFVVSRYTGRPLEEVFSGVFPHVVVHLILIALFIIFPGLVMWLPNSMGP